MANVKVQAGRLFTLLAVRVSMRLGITSNSAASLMAHSPVWRCGGRVFLALAYATMGGRIAGGFWGVTRRLAVALKVVGAEEAISPLRDAAGAVILGHGIALCAASIRL